MKKSVILSLLLMLVSSVAVAKHTYSYEGIPISGPKSEFAERMELQLFEVKPTATFTGTEYNIKGYYYGEECDLTLLSAKEDDDMIAGVKVATPMQKTWKEVFKKYKEYKKMFIGFYGKPFKEIEKKSPKNPKTDEEKFDAIYDGDASYICYFHDEQDGANGTVILSISTVRMPFFTMGVLDIRYLNDEIKAYPYGFGRYF